MRLIDAPIGIFRFDGELVLKTEYYSEDKQSGKYIPDCYIIRTGEYFWGGAKTANELINLNIEPVDFAELLPTVTDTISRQAAIDAVKERYYKYGRFAKIEELVWSIERLLTIQPDIIRCKDCKHHWTHKCMDSMPIERCDLEQTFYDAEHDFCSLAERREVNNA